MPLRRDGDSMGFRVDPKDFAPDETLVVQTHSARGNPREGYGGSVGVIRGRVAPCVLVPVGLPLP
ncbi:hypothetical protein GCM10009678_61340 [Actinomadura kijaniata]|uniref:Uncharacterized protein n=1 Tax=Actinomadura namibiensis TaxID=182080 RepID=A0A7W3QIF4_ACTNM|nr:hypothetical protein [Actinomadura namibiensis]MBA8948404.1 hypothetical protein [Actinomadura namibiensis]